ncbi:MAG: carbamoyltransferase [Pseudomonadales bacterium]|nr:carbamoyltransferase [Pseudomonadales bacterium]MCP5183334.1 carbamoyltransferase [Pseudomonadales bacterium]
MIILGLSGALGHDPSAALIADGEIVAAAEEERFLRDKHAKGRLPLHAARYCLAEAGIQAGDVDVVAFPYAPISLFRPDRWHYARRYWYAPDRALDALFNGNRRYRRNRRRVLALGDELGISWQRTRFQPVEHHLAHASSAYHLSGFEAPAAILGVDGKGEYATTFFGIGEKGRIRRLHEYYDPDSLAGAYGAITEYLGFEMLDGEYKVMGMAPYGDATRYDLSRILPRTSSGFRVDSRLVNTVGWRRYREGGKGFFFGPGLVEWLGPRRQGDAADEPYIHIAAAMQALFEERVLELLERHLGGVLRETGLLAYAGGGALNVKLNQRIVALPHLRELFVQPASGDSGTALGAASFVAAQAGECPPRMRHAYLGPAFGDAAIEAAVARRADKVASTRVSDIVSTTADLLAAGHPVAWFQGRMEFGPRALGNRSILGCPSVPGVADRINAQIKFRERWRPFCPSILDRVAREIIGTDHPAPYMTITFDVAPEWKTRIPEVVHEDGTARVQIVERDTNPRYYALLEAMEARTGNAVVLNTSLNRRGEAMVCSPDDALAMFLGCDLEYLVLGDYLVTRKPS